MNSKFGQVAQLGFEGKIYKLDLFLVIANNIFIPQPCMKQPSDFQCRQLLFEVGQEIGSCFLVLSLEAVDNQVGSLARILKFMFSEKF